MSTSMFDEYDIFKTMHPVKLQVMKELAENMQGKSMKDAAPLLMAATTKAKVEMMKNVVARQQKK